MRRILTVLLVLLVALAAYLLLWPVPIQPVVWSAPPDPGYQGPHAVNHKLAGLKHLELGEDVGPEHVVIRDGHVYAAVLSGAIVRLAPDGASREVVVNTGGRPLGFDFDARGDMIIADPMRGLLKATHLGANAKIDVLADTVDHPVKGDPILYADGVVVAPDGRIYFTDASRRFAPTKWGGTFNASVLDILEHQCTGRLLEHAPTAKTTRVVMTGLCFPNGLALSEDGKSLFLTETGEYRIWKVAVDAKELDAKQLAAQPSEQARVLLSNLPGYPDNLMRGQEGRIWVGFTKPRGAFVDKAAGKPWLRALSVRLPRSLWPVPKPYGHVFAFDEEGRVLVDMQDPSGAYPEATAVTETDDRLYIQSLHAKTLGWMDKKAAGL
ncbi:SMP-30/gluconolactonase/LRE family protein [Pyxidicoccus sp. MSG2]|uniref:SMP-30/gluconolactonase/LRE family protein n=1 Tax=Pyxidicoccus sp. MSG2 TaxID=2996790 RepID=UPI00226F9FFB|nr:SMP-30/gluconolactonase/LRE family protein [Pyxidicoccus sp. MSG2]MCY1019129.1 SMP-30/gluconolactonase/LRE family protein [Pyxidicoccus sp. MSG2]